MDLDLHKNCEEGSFHIPILFPLLLLSYISIFVTVVQLMK